MVQNDIGLIRTAKEIMFTDLIQPIALPSSPMQAGERVTLTGWGSFKLPELEDPDVLQFTEFQTISNEECVKRFAVAPQMQENIHNTTLCTVDVKDGGSCLGDSGI